MKQPIRYFSIGLITASIFLFIVLTFIDQPVSDVDDIPAEELIASIKDQGYHVLSSSEYITLTLDDEQESTDQKKEDKDETQKEEEGKKEKKEEDKEGTQEKDEGKKEKDKEKDKNKDKEKDKEDTTDDKKSDKKVYKYTLKIKENMLGPTISNLLAENKIISDAEEFSRYLETEGYAEFIQLGDFKLTSDMSRYEIAEKIAKKR